MLLFRRVTAAFIAGIEQVGDDRAAFTDRDVFAVVEFAPGDRNPDVGPPRPPDDLEIACVHFRGVLQQARHESLVGFLARAGLGRFRLQVDIGDLLG